MRLIDADAFKEYIRESFEEAKGEFQTEKYLKIADSVTEGFLKDIDEQPTVEAKPVEWIPCSERLPKPEEEVYVCAKRKYRGGDIRYIYTTAIYEDGAVSEHDSCWNWEEIEGEWDEENDCYIVPEGWWEDKHYNPDGVLNYPIYDEVIAWMPLPTPYNAERGGKNE